MQAAVFLDRDGTVIEEGPYLHDPNKVVLIPGAGAALKQLQDAGFALFVVTNQSGIGRGYYPESDMHRCNFRMQEYLAAYEVRITELFFAPEAPDEYSLGRKPKTFFIDYAVQRYGLSRERSYMAGDKLIDAACGSNARLRRNYLVLTGHGKDEVKNLADSPELELTVVAKDLAEVAQLILHDACSLTK